MQAIRTKEVWRIDEDGKIKDKFKKLTHVFIMSEKDFLTHYNEVSKTNCFHNPLPKFKNCIENLTRKIPELPFSNIWIASKICKALPNGSILHLGILNTLRAWNFFETNESISVYCNVGGFGIDGIMSTMIGASLVNPSKLYFAILGDLAFFYDLNSIGNRNIGNNVRIMLVNNGRGVEFHTYKHSASKFGEDTDKYIAAAWHNGNQSHTLVKSIAESLGLEYLSASDKDEFENSYGHFVNPQIGKPMIFEVFTHKADDADVLRLVRTINGESSTMKCKITSFMKESIGKPTAETIRKILKKQ